MRALCMSIGRRDWNFSEIQWQLGKGLILTTLTASVLPISMAYKLYEVASIFCCRDRNLALAIIILHNALSKVLEQTVEILDTLYLQS